MSLLFGETANPEDVTRRPGPWPDVNQRVEVFGSAWGAWLPSRVEDRRDARLVIAVPQDPAGPRPVRRPADWVAVRWTNPRGIGMLEATVIAASRAGIVPTWELVGRGEPALFQRRRYARVPVVMPARAVARRGAWGLTILDVAEGGIRCLAPQVAPFDPGEIIELSFDVDGMLFAARAEVVRWGLAPGGVNIVFRFTDLPRGEADRLRRFVFRQELAHNGAR
ncbi:MAG TPA: PilZ domain-containing protein [Acidimicrobiia bacterium]|nr:PilZ domain-containing protein [Acidimicrobiia bacterium]